MSEENAVEVQQILTDAIDCHRQGELTEAESRYLQVLERSPEHPDALHLLGVIAFQLGNQQLGLERVKQSLSANPAQPVTLNNYGNMLAECKKLDEAIDSYQRAIALNPDYAEAHHNLGNALSEAGRADEAVASYMRSIELRPESVGSRLAMAVTLEVMGRFEAAVEACRQVIELQADSLVARKRLGILLRKLHRLDEARVVYDEWLELAPADPLALHFRAACDPESAPPQAAADYVKVAFDDLAGEFDECVGDLQYQVPEYFRETLDQHLGTPSPTGMTIGDLGCGTGLCADSIRQRAETLIGIDLSTEMLSLAAEKECYDELIEADLVEHLLNSPAKYDLLVAGDSLIYFGDLHIPLAAAVDALRPGGHLLFSLEKNEGDELADGYQLSWSGRFVHDESFIRECLQEAGLEIVEFQIKPLRNEGPETVMGYVVLGRISER